MNEWVIAVLSNALVATFIAIAAIAVSRWWRKPGVAHALWVLVFIKLVTPPVFAIPLIQTGAREIGPSEIGRAEVGTVELASVEKAVPSAALPDRTPRDSDVSEARRSPARNAPARTSRQADTGDDEPASAPRSRDLSSAMLANESKQAIAGNSRRTRQTPQDVRAAISPPTITTGPNTGKPITSWLFPALIAFWLVGSVSYFVVTGWRIRKMSKVIAFTDPGDAKLTRFVNELSQRIGLRRAPEVRVAAGTMSPMIFSNGFSSQLIIPRDLLKWLDDQNQLETIVAHELAHLKRGDHWVRRLELIAVGLYWWLPTVWFAKRVIREVEEEICDAWVLATIPAANRSYAEALLNTADFLSSESLSLPPTGSAISHFRFIKRRIIMIMKGSAQTRLSWSNRLVMCVLSAAVLPLSFGLAPTATGGDEPQDKPAEVEALAELGLLTVSKAGTSEATQDDDELDAIKQEILEELKSEIDELDEEITEALEEVRSELMEELASAPPIVQKIVSEIDIDELLDEWLEDAPGTVQAFVEMVDVDSIIDEALDDVDLDDIDLSEKQVEMLQQLIESEVGGEFKGLINEMSSEIEEARQEVKQAMKGAPPEVRAVMEELDIDELLESLLGDTHPLVRQMAEEIGVEEMIKDEFNAERRERRRRRDRDDDDDADDDADDDGDDDDDADEDDDSDVEEIEQRLEERLEALLEEAAEIKKELRNLRRRRSGDR